MTVKECYEFFGGDYADAMSRLAKDERIAKYLRKLPDSRDFDEMNTNLAAGNWEDAFRNVHNLKGVSLNLGLTPLAEASSALCETVRHGAPTVDITGMVSDVKAAYEKILAAIELIDG